MPTSLRYPIFLLPFLLLLTGCIKPQVQYIGHTYPAHYHPRLIAAL
ncbi:hypothetical protein KQI65_07355 [bacterium]|nr:hypothetical protein [bacterium]